MLESCQALEMLQPGVPDLGAVKLQSSERAQALEMLQPSICNLGVVKEQLFELRDIVQHVLELLQRNVGDFGTRKRHVITTVHVVVYDGNRYRSAEFS